jgi:hypothetical protein
MFSIDQVHIVNDLFEKYAHLVPTINQDIFYRDQYSPGQLSIYASFYDELIESGIDFKVALSQFHELKDLDKKQYIYLLMALACLHADERQSKRLAEAGKAIEESTTNVKIFDVNKELDLNKINFDFIRKDPEALKALNAILPQGHEKWMNHVVKYDDAEMAFSLLDTPKNLLTASNIKTRLQDNPKLRRLIYGTSQHSIKDLYETYSYPFTENFKEDLFHQKMKNQANHPDLARHAEVILATCFHKLENAGRFGSRVDVGTGQEQAMARVLRLLKDAGADWYKAWCATREYDYIPALMDMLLDTFTDEERLIGYFTDSRIYSLSSGTIKDAARRVITQSCSPGLMCKVFAGRYDSDGFFQFFFGQTKNPRFLSMIESNQVKRDILTQSLDL